jgi:hypothetical protein
VKIKHTLRRVVIAKVATDLLTSEMRDSMSKAQLLVIAPGMRVANYPWSEGILNIPANLIKSLHSTKSGSCFCGTQKNL